MPTGKPAAIRYTRLVLNTRTGSAQMRAAVTVDIRKPTDTISFGGRWTLMGAALSSEGLRRGHCASTTIIKPGGAALFASDCSRPVPDAGISEVLQNRRRKSAGARLGCTSGHAFDDVWDGSKCGIGPRFRRHCVRARNGPDVDESDRTMIAPAETDCPDTPTAPAGGIEEMLSAVVAFVRSLAVVTESSAHGQSDSPGACCSRRWVRRVNRSQVTVQLMRADGNGRIVRHCSLHRSQGS